MPLGSLCLRANPTGSSRVPTLHCTRHGMRSNPEPLAMTSRSLVKLAGAKLEMSLVTSDMGPFLSPPLAQCGIWLVLHVDGVTEWPTLGAFCGALLLDLPG
jgi:hypothetical protein